MATKASLRQTKYDNVHCRTYGLKLNHGTDADIIEKLASVPSMQGYIKELIRRDILHSKIGDGIYVPNWESVVNLMDDEIRESVHADFAPCTEYIFLMKYMERHLEKYGKPFTW